MINKLGPRLKPPVRKPAVYRDRENLLKVALRKQLHNKYDWLIRKSAPLKRRKSGGKKRGRSLKGRAKNVTDVFCIN